MINTTTMSDRRSRSRTRSRSPSPGRNGRDRYDSRSRSRSRTPRDRSYTRSASRRNSPDQPKSAKIVVEKLTKNVNENHLREIFGSYGEIEELEMPMNRQFLTNRGIAYVLYTTSEDAENAIAHMHEAQLDGALINVSIVLPRRRFSRSPPPRRPPPNRFGEPHRYRDGPPPRGDRPYGRPGPPMGRGGRSPPRYSRGGGYNRPRSYSPDRSPPRRRGSPNYGNRSPSYSRSPPRRRYAEPPRDGRARREPSYSDHSEQGRRDRSYSRDRRR